MGSTDAVMAVSTGTAALVANIMRTAGSPGVNRGTISCPLYVVGWLFDIVIFR